jgi:hypothetical protein
MVVIAFLDGRPGHEKQTRGILMELGAMANLEVMEIKIRRRSLSGMIIDLVKLFAKRQNSIGIEQYRNAALLIGTGSQTHVPMLRMKQALTVPAVTCMMPAPYLRPLFDLCLVPLHDGIAEGGNIMTTVGPPNCSRPQGEKCQSAGLILLGGLDRKSHIWRSRETADQIITIAQREPSIHWTVSSSPRTPPDMVEMMVEIADTQTNVDFFRFEKTASGWIENQYARSRIVWVTVDSMSMVYEALSAGCQVGLLPVTWKRAENKFKRSADFLARKGLVLPYSSWLSDGDGSWQRHEPLNEAKRCAAEIVRRWPPKD